MIGCLKILKCSMMGYNSQNKVILVSLLKKFPFWARVIWAQFGPKISTLSHVSLSEDLFEVLWHDEALDKSSLRHFSKKFAFWTMQDHLAENYTTNCSRGFQKHSSIMWCNSQTLVIFVTFLKRLLFQTSGNSGKNGTTLFS